MTDGPLTWATLRLLDCQVRLPRPVMIADRLAVLVADGVERERFARSMVSGEGVEADLSTSTRRRNFDVQRRLLRGDAVDTRR